MILLIDNYDSFSYNLYQLIGSVEPDIKVCRNDGIDIDGIRKMHPDGIVLSPGPGRPEDAGICMDVVRELRGEIPILGVCLGHQAICSSFGATITYAKELMHGKQSMTTINNRDPIFRNLPEKIPVARYHSLAVEPSTIPSDLKVIATADDGEIMGVRSKDGMIYGLQFHPESIMTPDGMTIIGNFMRMTRRE